MKNRKKMFCYLITVLLFIFQLDKCLGGDCELVGLTEKEWEVGYSNKAILDTAVNEVIASFDTKNVKGVGFGDSSNLNKYFKIVFNDADNKLEIFTDPKFQDFEEEETQISALIKFTFTCTTDTRDLYFFQPITDTNNHAPSFDDEDYTFKLPMPFPPNYELTCMKQICATDIDLTNKIVEFQIDDDEFFQFIYDHSLGDKKHCASLKAKKQLAFEKPQEFKITVLDEGIPRLTGDAKLIIDVDEKENVPLDPRFIKALYLGNYEIDKPLKHEDIIVTEDTNTPDVNFEIVEASIGDFDTYFKVTSEKNMVKIEKNADLPQELLDQNSYIYLVIEAIRKNAANNERSVLLLDLPTPVIQTTTECPTISTEITTECPTIEPITCPPCTTEATTTVEPTTCPPCESCPTTDPIDPSTCPPCTTIEPLEPTTCPPCESTTDPTDPLTCPPCTTMEPLEPTTCPTCESCTTTDPTNPLTCPPCTTIEPSDPTECPTIEPCPTTDPTEPLTCPPCTTIEPSDPTECPTIEPCLTTDPTEPLTYPPCTTIEPSDPTACPTTEATTCLPCECASSSESGSTETTTCIPCPTQSTTSESSVTTESTSSCPTCPPCTETTTEKPGGSEISFDPSTIILEFDYGYKGHLYTAKIKENIDNIIYDWEADDDIKYRVSMNSDSGEMVMHTSLDPGDYEWNVTANDPASNSEAKLKIICKMLYKTTSHTISHALEIIEIDENKDSDKLVPIGKENDECHYVILNKISTEGACELTSDQKALVCKSIDREDPSFTDMIVPQIQVKLQMICDETLTNNTEKTYNASKSTTNIKEPRYQRFSSNYDDSKKHWVHTEAIKTNKNQMLVSIIINDVNDNPPVFDSLEYNVGYPKQEMDEILTLPYVAKIQATDKDAYPNNVITYSIDNNLFSIDEKIGTIYPRRDSSDEMSKQEMHTIIVSAFDSKYTTKTTVKVFMLSKKQITLLSIENANSEDIETVVKEINDKTEDMTLVVLTYSASSSGSNEDSKENYMKTSLSNVMNVLVFAVNNGNSVMQSKEVSEKLKDVNIAEWDIEITEEPELGRTIVNETNATGLIVAVSILACILAIVIGGVIAAYLLVIRPKRYQDFNNSETESNTNSVNKSFETPEMRDVGWSVDVPEPTTENIDPTESDSAWDAETRERKKSFVTFNEDVQEIQIEKL